MTIRLKCEARAMQINFFEESKETAEARCHDLASMKVKGYNLCSGCTEALSMILVVDEKYNRIFYEKD